MLEFEKAYHVAEHLHFGWSGLPNKDHYNIPWNSAEIGRLVLRGCRECRDQRSLSTILAVQTHDLEWPLFPCSFIEMAIFTLQLDLQKTKAWPLLWRNHLRPEKIVALPSYWYFAFEHLLPMSASNSQQNGTPTCSMRPCRVSSRKRMANL